MADQSWGNMDMDMEKGTVMVMVEKGGERESRRARCRERLENPYLKVPIFWNFGGLRAKD